MIANIDFLQVSKDILAWAFAFVKVVVATLGWKGLLLVGAIILISAIFKQK